MFDSEGNKNQQKRGTVKVEDAVYLWIKNKQHQVFILTGKTPTQSDILQSLIDKSGTSTENSTSEIPQPEIKSGYSEKTGSGTTCWRKF